MTTVAQRKWLSRADSLGNIRYNGPNGFGRSSWVGAMERLAKAGLVEPNAHGEYTLTKKGEAYNRGAEAAKGVWSGVTTTPRAAALRESRWSAETLEAVSDWIGPNVHHPEAVKAGATECWLDLRAGRIYTLHNGRLRDIR